MIQQKNSTSLHMPLKYPTRNLVLAIVTTVVALFLLGATLLFSLRISKFTENYAIPVRELQIDMMYQAGRAKDAVTLYALTGKSEWKEEYAAANSALNRSIDEVLSLSQNQKIHDAFRVAQQMNEKLALIRERAMTNASAGLSGIALSTFLDDQYVSLEEEYKRTLREVTETVNETRIGQLRREQGIILASLISSGILGALVLPMAWLRLFSAHLEWRDALNSDNAARTAAEKDLQSAYNELNRDLGIARELQRRQLPSFTNLKDVRFAWFFESASHVGGDTLGYFALDDRYVCFYVLDVAGHGIASSLLAFNAQQQILNSARRASTLLQQLDHDTEAMASSMVSEFNKSFMLVNDPSVYFTMVYAVLDTLTGYLTMVQAGHPPPIHVKADGTPAIPMGDGGLPIGILPDAEFVAFSVTLSQGDRVYLYSDGVTECRNSQDVEFGQTRLELLLSRCADKSLPDSSQHIHQEVLNWRAGAQEFADDITFLAVQYR